jgi:ADP-ribose pyrophosphatase YjhB (NUDIX family)
VTDLLHAILLDAMTCLMTSAGSSQGWLAWFPTNYSMHIAAGAIREAQEEAGVDITLKGLLNVQCQPERMWRRVIFYAGLSLERV